MQRNAITRKVTVESIMRSRPFVVGHAASAAGTPFDPEAFTDPSEQWKYEKGRMFGVVFKGSIKAGRAIRPEAKAEYVQLKKDRVIL